MYRIFVTKISANSLRKKANLHYPQSLRQHRFASDKTNVCPPPKKKHNSGAFYTVGFFTLIGGGTIAYAKYDPNFRQWLGANVPLTDGFIKFLFQEERTYLESFTDALDSIKGSVLGVFVGAKKTKVSSDIPVTPKDYHPPSPAFSKLADSKKEEAPYNEIRVEKVDKEKTEVTIGGDKKPAENLYPSHPKKILELETKIGGLASEAVQAYNKAVTALRNYSKNVEVVIENSVERLDPEIWNSLRQKTKAKEQTTREAEQLYKETQQHIKQLESILQQPDFQAPDVTKKQAQINITRVQEDIRKAKDELDELSRNLSLTDKYWSKVEEARNHFIEEIETLFPGVNIHDRKLTLQGGELDLFILHAFSNVLFYQKELCKLQVLEQQKIRVALENARKGNAELLTDAQIDLLIDKERKNLALEFQKKCLALRAESEKELRHQLKVQSEAFADHLHDALESKENELGRNFARDLDEKVMAEKCKFKLQLSALAGRVRGMDQVFKARMESDTIKKQSQLLWSACQSLFRALKAGCPGVPWTEQLRPLESEITAVKNAAAETDELVKTVLSGIPAKAKERGVFPEDALRERFLKVETVARQLALVPEGGARLPLHILSFIHAMLLVKAASPIPQAELEDSEVDFRGLSTNDILQRARYWIDRGDFAQTLRYMNLLDGASRIVASQWIDETRLLLETQQAANVLLAHASASGLMHL
ncbi:hypothetical protein PPYR_11686 [Photinus pyralis]|uniref:MICOS complex subunit MIC60 n=1 Tax=Photinus pyralis TaxID=7054 RepID=A0A1Y1MRL2_PHOPY|nr:MICOS complex subunit Mic60 [Photinus pyralis]XP_031350677.1 MICOS complex subunit Mic60 [Photinus pyralis]KAB0794847.1 hypothetical protein PPYR_11686 [Photinus pyralis]